MSGGIFNGAMAKAREIITRLRFEADQSALDEQAQIRGRELDADEYAARVSPGQRPATSPADGEADGPRPAPP